MQSIRLHGRRFERGYAFRPHVQPFHQFYCVLDGLIAQRVETATHTLRGGQALWIASGLEREPRAVTRAGEYLVIEFAAPWPELGRGGGSPVSLDAAAMADARELARLQPVTEDDQRASILFHRLCLRLLPAAWFSAPKRPGAEARRDARSRELERLVRIERLLAANTGNPLTLQDIAALAGMSRSALGRLFATHRGRSPCARFRELRLDRARQLLERGGRSVTEVAGETCFSSSQHFAGAFRRRFRCAPSAVAPRRPPLSR